MPKFTQEPVEKKAGKVTGVPQEVVDQYKGFIEKLEKDNVGRLEFDKGEDINLGRKALQEASIQLKKYVKARKVRGSGNVLMFERISKREFDEAKKRVEARVAKMRGKKRGGRKAKK